jgi:uncharacterized cysteine cluster protein YcgN (CxxCxxCC family)
MSKPLPFWKTKRLEDMNRAEWESLCDGCGRCCLHKLRDEATDELSFTEVACHLLDLHTCRCQDYANRKVRVPDCVGLTAEDLCKIDWLPPTCAYRRLADGKDLAWWHPLVSASATPGPWNRISSTGRGVCHGRPARQSVRQRRRTDAEERRLRWRERRSADRNA